jgi:hypothetical protein
MPPKTAARAAAYSPGASVAPTEAGRAEAMQAELDQLQANIDALWQRFDAGMGKDDRGALVDLSAALVDLELERSDLRLKLEGLSVTSPRWDAMLATLRAVNADLAQGMKTLKAIVKAVGLAQNAVKALKGVAGALL